MMFDPDWLTPPKGREGSWMAAVLVALVILAAVVYAFAKEARHA